MTREIIAGQSCVSVRFTLKATRSLRAPRAVRSEKYNAQETAVNIWDCSGSITTLREDDFFHNRAVLAVGETSHLQR